MSDVNLQISKEIITPIIESKIKQSLIEAFGQGDALIKKAVDSILYDKVTASGVTSTYSSENKYSWLDVMVRQTVESVARQTFLDILNEKKPELTAAIRSALTKKGNLEKFALTLIDGLTQLASSPWRFEAKFYYKD